jgi:DNA polymerase III subunit epsilon
MRQIVLDTETTGMNRETGGHFTEGHRIIEIGCVELVDRKLTGNHFHVYINPQQPVDPEAFAVHGISDDFLADKPVFKDVARDFIDFIQDAEVIAHNAPFDVGFMNLEFAMNPATALVRTEQICQITDSLDLAKKLRPGQRNNLDALCKEYGIDNSHRDLHGALLDAEILADVYLLMTSSQEVLSLDQHSSPGDASGVVRITPPKKPLKVLTATADEIDAHEARLDIIEQAGAACLYRQQ